MSATGEKSESALGMLEQNPQIMYALKIAAALVFLVSVIVIIESDYVRTFTYWAGLLVGFVVLAFGKTIALMDPNRPSMLMWWGLAMVLLVFIAAVMLQNATDTMYHHTAMFVIILTAVIDLVMEIYAYTQDKSPKKSMIPIVSIAVGDLIVLGFAAYGAWKGTR